MDILSNTIGAQFCLFPKPVQNRGTNLGTRPLLPLLPPHTLPNHRPPPFTRCGRPNLGGSWQPELPCHPSLSLVALSPSHTRRVSAAPLAPYQAPPASPKLPELPLPRSTPSSRHPAAPLGSRSQEARQPARPRHHTLLSLLSPADNGPTAPILSL